MRKLNCIRGSPTFFHCNSSLNLIFLIVGIDNQKNIGLSKIFYIRLCGA